MLQSDLCDYSDVYIFVKGLLLLQNKIIMNITRN